MITDVNQKLYEKMKRCREVEKSARRKVSDAEDYIHIASKAEAALYNGWARTAWSLGLGYIMLACCLGRGGKICLIFIIYILNQYNLLIS